MSKKAEGIIGTGTLAIPFEPFQGDCLPTETECIIHADLEDRYRVGFPGKIGYAGTFFVKKSYVNKN